jgi:hypothetical protein
MSEDPSTGALVGMLRSPTFLAVDPVTCTEYVP